MDQIFGVTLLALQLLSCVLIYKSVKNKNYTTYKFPRCGRRSYIFERFTKFGLVCCFILTSITVLLILFDPEFGGAFVMLPLGFLGWYLCLFMYLDCKNFYLQTTPEGMMWANFLAISHHAPYKDIVKFTYNSRNSGDIGIDLTWLVVKTACGGTLRFDPILTDAGLLMAQLAFRLRKGYWARIDSPEDQREIQEYLETTKRHVNISFKFLVALLNMFLKRSQSSRSWH